LTSGGFCEYGNGLLFSAEGGEFLDYLSDYNFSERTLLHQFIIGMHSEIDAVDVLSWGFLISSLFSMVF
jgi:hypothetical protein